MKVAHFICKREGTGLRHLEFLGRESGLWRSGNWDLTLEQAQGLIGGRVYLHETKSKPSAFGGEVVEVEPVVDETLARKDRIAFILKPAGGDKGVAWRGRSDAMASYGGILEV